MLNPGAPVNKHVIDVVRSLSHELWTNREDISYYIQYITAGQ
jgi:hypothetical protein